MAATLEDELCFEDADSAEPEEEVDCEVVELALAGAAVVLEVLADAAVAAIVLEGQLATDGSVTPTTLGNRKN